MSKLKFSDGEEFDLEGELRTELRADGWYVVGKGMLVPVDSEEDGNRVVDRFNFIGQNIVSILNL